MRMLPLLFSSKFEKESMDSVVRRICFFLTIYFYRLNLLLCLFFLKAALKSFKSADKKKPENCHDNYPLKKIQLSEKTSHNTNLLYMIRPF